MLYVVGAIAHMGTITGYVIFDTDTQKSTTVSANTIIQVTLERDLKIENLAVRKTRNSHYDMASDRTSERDDYNELNQYYLQMLPACFNINRYTTLEAQTFEVHNLKSVLVGINKTEAKVVSYNPMTRVFEMQTVETNVFLDRLGREDCCANAQVINNNLYYIGSNMWDMKTTIEKQKIVEEAKRLLSLLKQTNPDYNIEFMQTNKSNLTLTKFRVDNEQAKIVLPTGITDIGNNCFYGTVADTIMLPDTVREIHSEGFRSCQVNSIYVKPGCRTIGKSAFAYSRIGTLVLSEGIESINNNAFIGTWVSEPLTLPQSVLSIECNAFRGAKMCLSYAKWGIRFIGELAFYQMSLHPKQSTLGYESSDVLQGVPESVRSVQSRAYDGIFLKDINVPTGSEIASHAFLRNLSPVIVWRSIEDIPVGAFYQARCQEVHISEGCEVVHNNAFYDCVNLEVVYFPSTLSQIPKGAFRKCNPLMKFLPSNPNATSVCEKLNDRYARAAMFGYDTIDAYERAVERVRTNLLQGRKWYQNKILEA